MNIELQPALLALSGITALTATSLALLAHSEGRMMPRRHNGRLSKANQELSASANIPYTAHVDEYVVKTKAGDYVQAFRLTGASFESADDEEINTWHDRLNVLWRNLATDQIALWSHVVRRRARPPSFQQIAEGFAGELESHYQQRVAGETLMVNELYLAVVYRPQAGAVRGPATRMLARSKAINLEREGQEALDACGKLRAQLLAALDMYEPTSLGIYEKEGRHYSSLLEYFGLLTNGEHQRIPLPRAPIDQVLATSRVFFGAESVEYRTPTQTRVGAFIGIKEYPTPTQPGMYNLLLRADFPFVLTQSFTFLPKATAQGLLTRQYNRMRNAQDMAVSQAEQLREALDALTSNEFVMGDHHFSLHVLADPLGGAEASQGSDRLRQLLDHIAMARNLLADSGMVVAREDLALEAAYWAQLPGNFAFRPRKAPITSRNFAAMAPHHNFPRGRATGNHWGDALAMLITSARSPYYFSLHASDPLETDGGSRRDIGHTSIIGPTGSGKTVLIGFLLCMLRKANAAQVVFDKDRGLEILVRAERGKYLVLRNGIATAMNPLQLPPTPDNVEFLKVWLRSLVERSGAPMAVSEQRELTPALQGVLALPREARRLSRLLEFLDPTDPEGVYERLAPWCEKEGGDRAWVFDNPADQVADLVSDAPLIGIDVTDFLDNDVTRTPVTLYLFHIVRRLLDGRRMVVWMDEFSKLLSDPAFESFAKDGLKTWRKLEGVAVFATQSPSDVLLSPIARTLVEQTATKIFFPNADAVREDYIDGFGLSEQEYLLVKEGMLPGSRLLLIKQGHQSVVCELDLRGFDYELSVISGRISNVDIVSALIAKVGSDAARWLPLFRDRVTTQRAEGATDVQESTQ